MVRQGGQQLTDILGIKDKTLDSRQTIDSYSFDKTIYKDIHDRSPAIQKTVAEGDEIIKTYPDLAQDLFMGLYKHKPNLLEEQDMAGTHKFNHKLMQEVMESPEFKKLRSKTRLDMISSALGFEVMSNEAVQIIKQYEQQMKEEQQENGQQGENTMFDDINEQMEQEGGSQAPGGAGEGDDQQGQQGQDQGQGQGQQQQGGGGQGGMTPEQAQQQANQQNQQQQNGQGQGQQQGQPDPQALQDALDKMKNQMTQAAEKALDDVKDTQDFLQAWGMDGGDPNNRITYEDKKAALARLRKSPRLQELSDLIGRMKKLAINEQKQKAPDGAEAIKSVKTGNTIESVLPSEKAQLSSKKKALKRGFYRKYNDKELLEYDMDVYESMGKGPMIACVDTSGSMNGEPEKWSKAVALALLEVANKQKRNFACLHFDHTLRDVWEVPHGQLRPEYVFDMAEKFSGGGTNFEEPLRKALEIMEGNKFKKGDIVFITDGHSHVSDSFLERLLQAKKDKEFKIITVMVNMGTHAATGAIKTFSDKIINTSDITTKGTTSAKDIFRNV